jgi:hypothetical protein
MKKITESQQWMIDHPDDEPPPVKSGGAFHAWRIKRGIGASAQWAQARREWRAANAAAIAKRPPSAQ